MLPSSGQIACAKCHRGQPYAFARTMTTVGDWRITNNPLAWGNPKAEVVVLGFSKGPTQAGALASQLHEEIAFRGGRTSLAKILHYVGLIDQPDRSLIDRAIADPQGRFHFASLVRCTVEQRNPSSGIWTGTGGGMLDKFASSSFGSDVVSRCMTEYLADLPMETRLVIMLGLGSAGNYVKSCQDAFKRARPGRWSNVNDVTYRDDKIVVVHTEHFKSQGALIPNWLSGSAHSRGRLGILAREGVALSGSAME